MSVISNVERLMIRRYRPSDAEDWDRFVADSVNGTIMHSQRFLSYHPADRFQDHSLLFAEDSGRLVALFPAAAVRKENHRELRSHPGASYGGLVISDGFSKRLAERVVKLLVEQAHEAGFDSIWMRQTEPVFHKCQCEALDAALHRCGFHLEGRELSSAVSVSKNSSVEVPASFRGNARRAAYKALRAGVTVGRSLEFDVFWRILARNLQDRYAAQPTHTLDEILYLKELFPEKIDLIAATAGGEMVAGAVLLHMNATASHTMYMAQDYRYQSLRALNLVLAKSVAVCALRGASWLNYGISSLPGSLGSEINEGVLAFKRSCGGEDVFRDIFVKRVLGPG